MCYNRGSSRSCGAGRNFNTWGGPLQRKTLPGLDGIRLTAILWIVVYHFGVETTSAGVFSPGFFTTTFCAALVQVAVFWMTALSGACLGLKYARAPWHPPEYAKSRFLAIYPLFWLFFFPLFLYSDVLHHNNAGVAPWRLIFSVAGLDGYLQAWTPTFYKIGEWYLACQILLYCLFPLLLLARRSRAGRVLAVLVPALLWAAVPFVLPATVDVFHTVCGQLPAFALGTLFGRWMAAPDACPRALPWGVSAGLVCLAGAAAAAGLPDYYTTSAAALGLFWPAFALGQLLRGVVAAAAHRAARLCYGVYLVHHVGITLVLIPRLQAAQAGPALWAAGLVLCLAGAFAAAWVGQWILKHLPAKR